MSVRLTVRKLTESDRLDKIAELIYFTDKYIFPYMFGGDLEQAKKVFVQMIKTDTIYNFDNIYAAFVDGEPVAIVIMKRTPLNIAYQDMLNAYLSANSVIDARFGKVYNEYYALLNDEPEGVYISNVCVDKAFRGMGIAKQLLLAVLKDSEEYHLETVKKNAAARALYLSLGFEIVEEYAGFTGVPCLRMTRTIKER